MRPEDVPAELVEAMQGVSSALRALPPWVIAAGLAAVLPQAGAGVLEGFAASIRSELDATDAAGVDLGEEYLNGMHSALRQAEDAAALLRTTTTEEPTT